MCRHAGSIENVEIIVCAFDKNAIKTKEQSRSRDGVNREQLMAVAGVIAGIVGTLHFADALVEEGRIGDPVS
jgi:hypothetical protein